MPVLRLVSATSPNWRSGVAPIFCKRLSGRNYGHLQPCHVGLSGDESRYLSATEPFPRAVPGGGRRHLTEGNPCGMATGRLEEVAVRQRAEGGGGRDPAPEGIRSEGHLPANPRQTASV